MVIKSANYDIISALSDSTIYQGVINNCLTVLKTSNKITEQRSVNPMDCAENIRQNQ